MADVQLVGPVTFLKMRAQNWLLKLLPVPPLSGSGSWYRISEPYTGAWQQNVAIDYASVHTYATVFACETLIASDIAKLRPRLVALDGNGIWTETESPSFSPVLRKPNRYQTRIKFIEQWILSKLIHGAAYILKQRDNRNVVSALYVLDATKVQPLEAPDGSVYFELKKNWLAGLQQEKVMVPARDIIFDPMYTPWHPLIGVSPITACGLAATQGLGIQENSTTFFGNGSRPGGVLTAPGAISQATADRIKETWDTNFSGLNAGKVAVLGDGLKYEQMSISAQDSQLIEQLKWTSETVCSAFHVPSYMVGVGPPPNYNNIEALNQQYYSQCLQVLIESLELSLDEGLELPKPFGTELDIDDLLRMDSATMMATIERGTKAGVMTPNEGRLRLNLGPTEGGDTPYLQQQNYSLAALERIGQGKADVPEPAPVVLEAQNEEPDINDELAKLLPTFIVKAAEEGLYAA